MVSKLDFCDLLQVKIEWENGIAIGVPGIKVSSAGSTITKGAVGTVGTAFFVGGEGKLIGLEGFDFINQPGEILPVGVVLSGGVRKVEGLIGKFGEPVDHLDLFGLEGVAAVEVGARLDQDVAIDAGLQTAGQGCVMRALGVRLGGFPIHNDGPVGFDGEKVVFGEELLSGQGGGEDGLCVAFGRQVGREIGEVVIPPAGKVGIGELAGKAVYRQAQLVLLDELVETRAQVHELFVNEGRFCFKSRPGKLIQIPELKPAFAIGEVLKGGLRKAEVSWERGHVQWDFRCFVGI